MIEDKLNNEQNNTCEKNSVEEEHTLIGKTIIYTAGILGKAAGVVTLAQGFVCGDKDLIEYGILGYCLSDVVFCSAPILADYVTKAFENYKNN
jgi:hypothetical protein